jgi:competence protein ComEC
MGGPEVTRHHIAPFLWHRGRRRIDELFLSHADLDHFNGVVDLLDRFDVGLVTCTPSFADKALPGVRRTLAAIRERGIPIRIVKAGDRLDAGAVTIDVLHPPAKGPAGNENSRSMVLRIVHRGHVILLTGDLESPGLEMVTHGQRGSVDVMMSPHHGSAAANTKGLANWAMPQLVVVPDSKAPKARKEEPYAGVQAQVWVTEVDGAVTVRSADGVFAAESFRSRRQLILRETGD